MSEAVSDTEAVLLHEQLGSFAIPMQCCCSVPLWLGESAVEAKEKEIVSFQICQFIDTNTARRNYKKKEKGGTQIA